MNSMLHNFAALDQAIAAAPAVATLVEVEMVLRSATGGALSAIGFRWWRSAPERRTD